MADGLVERALMALGREAGVPVIELPGSQSRSGVYRVRADGHEAVLKVTGAGGEQDNARRELTFYRTLAPDVPVATPELLDSVDNEELTALLLTAHAPPRGAIEWDRSAWLELARQLAALHSISPPAQGPWSHRPWIQDVLHRPPTPKAERYWSRTEAADGVARLLGASAELAQALDAVPACFVHGDCHVDNLLRDGERIVWTDWQVAGIACPATDLAFVASRANADGADVPSDAMLHEYAAQRGMEPEPLRRATAAAELGFLLFGWPDWAAYHTADEQDRLTRRMRRLTEYWSSAR